VEAVKLVNNCRSCAHTVAGSAAWSRFAPPLAGDAQLEQGREG
jgi:hypothetical protein